MRAFATAWAALFALTGPALADPGAFGALNDLRAGHNQPAVTYSTTLEDIARTHATDMQRGGFFSHTGSDGSSIGDRARRVGYGFCFVAENLAKGPDTGAEAVALWRTSEGHYRNMLDPRATEVGVAQAPGQFWVMVLGRPGC